MEQKVIAISLDNHNISVDQFKKALCIFNVSKVHLGKHEAVVQFSSNKDFESFQFTNSNNKIVSLNGAIYKKLPEFYQWQFSQEETQTLQDLKDRDLDETQTQSVRLQQGNQSNIEKLQEGNNFHQQPNVILQADNTTLNQIIKEQKIKQIKQRAEFSKQDDGQQIQKQLNINTLPDAKLLNQNQRNAQSSTKIKTIKSFKYPNYQYAPLYAFLLALFFIIIAIY